jgi:hypothetical protein
VSDYSIYTCHKITSSLFSPAPRTNEMNDKPETKRQAPSKPFSVPHSDNTWDRSPKKRQ